MQSEKSRWGIAGLVVLAALEWVAVPARAADRVVIAEEFTSTN